MIRSNTLLAAIARAGASNIKIPPQLIQRAGSPKAAALAIDEMIDAAVAPRAKSKAPAPAKLKKRADDEEEEDDEEEDEDEAKGKPIPAKKKAPAPKAAGALTRPAMRALERRLDALERDIRREKNVKAVRAYAANPIIRDSARRRGVTPTAAAIEVVVHDHDRRHAADEGRNPALAQELADRRRLLGADRSTAGARLAAESRARREANPGGCPGYVSAPPDASIHHPHSGGRR